MGLPNRDEVEGKWDMILADFLDGELKPLYSFAQDLQSLVDIEDSPLPKTSSKTMEHFAYPSFGTADTSRGCPFACSFCTIINVQGRKMREREAGQKAVETKGEDELKRAALMAAWTRKQGKDDKANPYSKANYKGG